MNNDTPQPTVKDSLTPQNLRCPVPYHLWKKEWLAMHIVADKCIAITHKDGYDFHLNIPFDLGEIEYVIGASWTRAEALASQMLTAPDRVGVWLVKEEGYPDVSLVFTDLTIHQEEVNDIDNDNKYTQYWINDTLGDAYVVYPDAPECQDCRFYFMGPLPTAESEVPSE